MTSPRRPSGQPPTVPAVAPRGALAAAALAAGGWLLITVSVPVAIFLTWWGDCAEDVCPSASGLDRTAYLFDFGAWIALPALAFLVYRGWRPAAVAIVAVGLALTAQVVAGMVGARGFEAFVIVLPAAALVAAAGVIGLRPALGSGGGGDVVIARNGLAGLVILSVVVVAIAFQGLLAGGGGAGLGLLVLVATSLSVVTIAAVLNRSRRPPPPGQPHR